MGCRDRRGESDAGARKPCRPHWPHGRRAGADDAASVVDQRRAVALLQITNYYSSDEKRALFRDGAAFRDSMEVLRRDIAGAVRRSLAPALYLYCQNWLVEDLLMKADKMTMAASLELRAPFLDFRLVEWMARAPASDKLRPRGEGYETKAALRDHARALLPAEIIERPKKGFPVPVYRWLSDRLQPLVMDRLASPSAQGRHRAWNLLVLVLWLERWAA
jgi:asparagine synthase (glutamine-hydrolysing)